MCFFYFFQGSCLTCVVLRANERVADYKHVSLHCWTTSTDRPGALWTRALGLQCHPNRRVTTSGESSSHSVHAPSSTPWSRRPSVAAWELASANSATSRRSNSQSQAWAGAIHSDLNQNSRLKTQFTRRWSTVSEDWLHRAQESLWRRPCLNSMCFIS
jgi:hypothetical protein